MSPGQWSATERRVVEPYARADSALEGVRFRFDAEDEFKDDAITWFDRDVIARKFEPEFLFDVSPDLVESAARIPQRDLRAAVVVRDRALKRWEAVATWPLPELPPNFAPRVPSRRFALGRRMEFALLVTPRERLPERSGRAYRPDQVVAERSFESAVRREGTRFNVATVGPKWFTDQGLPKDTVWAIDWDTRDPMVEPIAALTVVVNERFADQLQNAFSGEVASGVLAGQIAIDVFVEASFVALQNAVEYDPEDGTLLGAVLAGLGVNDPSDFAKLKEKVEDDAGRVTAMSFIRARVQARAGLGRLLSRSQLGGRR